MHVVFHINISLLYVNTRAYVKGRQTDRQTDRRISRRTRSPMKGAVTLPTLAATELRPIPEFLMPVGNSSADHT